MPRGSAKGTSGRAPPTGRATAVAIRVQLRGRGAAGVPVRFIDQSDAPVRVRLPVAGRRLPVPLGDVAHRAGRACWGRRRSRSSRRRRPDRRRSAAAPGHSSPSSTSNSSLAPRDPTTFPSSSFSLSVYLSLPSGREIRLARRSRSLRRHRNSPSSQTSNPSEAAPVTNGPSRRDGDERVVGELRLVLRVDGQGALTECRDAVHGHLRHHIEDVSGCEAGRWIQHEPDRLAEVRDTSLRDGIDDLHPNESAADVQVCGPDRLIHFRVLWLTGRCWTSVRRDRRT